MSQRITLALCALGLLASLLFTPATVFASQANPVSAAPMQTDPCLNPTAYNEIVQENCLPGNPVEEWDIVTLTDDPNVTTLTGDSKTGVGDPTIQGYATQISVDQGETVEFKIKTDSTDYKIDIYRLGYYQGNGARLITTVEPSAALPQEQPACYRDYNEQTHTGTGRYDCTDWAVSASWNVPTTATSGIYLARLQRQDGANADNPGSHIVFIVRDDDGGSDILFKTSDTTWQAYNMYGGANLYPWYGGDGPLGGRGASVTYNRPFTTRLVASGQDWVFHAEYPMVRWLERNGYDVSYFAAVDLARFPSELTEHKILTSTGHDEYWSSEMRTAVIDARNAGVNLAFFSGNEIFWKTRWPNVSPETTWRTMVSYKETHEGYKIDPEPHIWTGTWRDNRSFNPEYPATTQPENSVSGQIFTGVPGASGSQMRVPEAEGKLRFWRDTEVALLGPGEDMVTSGGIIGYEYDEPLDNGFRPAGLFLLSETVVPTDQYLLDNGDQYGQGTGTHAISLYRDRVSGALVFGAGTVQWSWALDNVHDNGHYAYGATETDSWMQQATVNLFADMDDVQPQTLEPGLTRAAMSFDTTPPTSAVTSHTTGQHVQGSTVLAGTATDIGGRVGGVEVSTDGGASWHPAQGRENWSYAWTPITPGAATIQVRAVDDSGWIQQSPTSISLIVDPRSCPCSIWESQEPPASRIFVDADPVVLGMRFVSDQDGYITKLRFYAESGITAGYTGQVWTNSGSLLGSTAFLASPFAGWQEARLDPPVEVDAGVVYVATYHSPTGAYVYSPGGFDTAVVNPPVSAPAATQDQPNGVYVYSTTPAFPAKTYANSNYWIDVVYEEVVTPDTTPPVVAFVNPANGDTNVAVNARPSATFDERLDGTTVTPENVKLLDGTTEVAISVSYVSESRRIVISPEMALGYSKNYKVVLKGGTGGIENSSNIPMASDYEWVFFTRSAPPPPPVDGPGGPILVVGSASNPFTLYYSEILRAEGLNAFAVSELSTITAATLAPYKVVIVGEMALSPAEAQMFSDWVNAGGNLIAMRPDSDLLALAGLTAASGPVLQNGYLRVNTSVAPGAGIVAETIQYHGDATLYELAGANTVATLYTNATTATANPAVTLNAVGGNGGQAAAFAFDLARSVVYTRQGNPNWASDERDGLSPIRSNDKFFGAKPGDGQLDWVNLGKVAIPQADEIQRLLANMITYMLVDDFPMPRFWYFPRGEKAVVVMTHDDHGGGDIEGRLNFYNASSPVDCNVANWDCVRSTTYVYPYSQLSGEDIEAYEAQGHEFGVHLTTNCGDYTFESLSEIFSFESTAYTESYPSANPQRTLRTHCVAFSDWFSQPTLELDYGIRLDTNYYHWPAMWVLGRQGMFTGSGMPMRFANVDGTMIDVYQAATQMTDESGQAYPATINVLLQRALGPEGYYGAFVANQHTDGLNADTYAEATIASAQNLSVPVISAKQLLEWTDARNTSSFANIAYNAGNKTLTFQVAANPSANGLTGLVPAAYQGDVLTTLTHGGIPVAFTPQTIKGVPYAQFAAAAGEYVAVFDEPGPDGEPPTILTRIPALAAEGVSLSTNVAVQFDEPIDQTTLNATTFALRAEGETEDVPATITYDAGSNTATLDPDSNLAPNTVYHVTVAGSIADLSGNILGDTTNWHFTTLMPSNLNSIWPDSPTPLITDYPDDLAYDLGVKFQSSVPGSITAIRFYRGAASGTGPFVGKLWSADGTLLGTTPNYTMETSGWQEVNFTEPIPIAPNTTYVASYFAPIGGYAYESGWFGTPVVSGPLTALETGPGNSNGVFRLGGGFPNQGPGGSNYWVDVLFEPGNPDTEAPTIEARVPAPDAVDVPVNTNVTIQFSEAMHVATITAESITLRAQDAIENVAASVTYNAATKTAILNPTDNLAPATVYIVTVAAEVTDLSAIPLAAPATWQFTTRSPAVGDETAADFALGDLGNPACYISAMGDGGLILAPDFATEFDTAIPEGWVSNWNVEGQAAVADGVVNIDGALVSPQIPMVSSGAIEFVATFGAQPYQHGGFGVAFEAGEPWAIFSTSGDPSSLWARVYTGNVMSDENLGPRPVGPHLYRIEWDATSIRFYIDGVLVHTVATFSGFMRPVFSDNDLGVPLTVDWVHASPYDSPCTFTSSVKDAGALVNWQSLFTTGARPNGTSVLFETRSGNVADPDGTWSPWAALTGNVVASPDGRYIQYRATLATTNVHFTPVVADVSITHVDPSIPGASFPLNITWNLISLPRDIGTVTIQEALQPIDGQYALVYAFDVCQTPEDDSDNWRLYNPSATEGNTLTDHDPNSGYWVFATDALSFELQGVPFADTSVDLCVGWNLVGYPQDVAKPIEEVIGASCEDKVRMIYTFDLSASAEGAPWLVYDPTATTGNTIENFEPGRGYWVYTNEACTLGAAE